jgi:hypothetical protein
VNPVKTPRNIAQGDCLSINSSYVIYKIFSLYSEHYIREELAYFGAKVTQFRVAFKTACGAEIFDLWPINAIPPVFGFLGHKKALIEFYQSGLTPLSSVQERENSGVPGWMKLEPV